MPLGLDTWHPWFVLVALLAYGILWCVEAEPSAWRMEHGVLSCKLELEIILISKAAPKQLKHVTWEREGLTFAYPSSWLMRQGMGKKRMLGHPSKSKAKANGPWRSDPKRMWVFQKRK